MWDFLPGRPVRLFGIELRLCLSELALLTFLKSLLQGSASPSTPCSAAAFARLFEILIEHRKCGRTWSRSGRFGACRQRPSEFGGGGDGVEGD